MKLSIIIPVYNVEKYIEKCILSCEDQNIPSNDYEIIVVNDGSPDESLAIIEELSKKFSNISIISQENQGLSAARNAGLKRAKGEYVWFVDSDDSIASNCLFRICSKLKDELDILHLQYRNVYDDETKSFDEPFTLIDGIRTGIEVTLNGGLPAPAQFSIYRRTFLELNHLSFVKGIYHEDSEFKPRAVYQAKKIASDDHVSYYYYQRSSGNIMSSFTLKRAIDVIFVNNSLYSFSKELDYEVKRAINLKISTNLNSLFCGYWKLPSKERKIVKKLLNNNRHLFECMVNCPNKKYFIEGLTFRYNTTFALQLYRLLK